MIKVKNINHTSQDRYSSPKGYDSWEEFWEIKSGQSFPKKCQNINCKNAAEVGAHVKKTSGDHKWYIVPLCKKCNHPKNTDAFYVHEDQLVAVSDEDEGDGIINSLIDEILKSID